MPRFLLILTLLLALVGAGISWLSRPIRHFAFDQPIVYSAESIGGPESGAPMEIWRPQGPGPFPAVLLLHGTGGNSAAERQWARRMVEQGYAGVILDSYGPRCGHSICGHSTDVSPIKTAVRAVDFDNALAFLRTQPGIDPDRLAAIGFSQGASAALIGSAVEPGRKRMLRALVAYYSPCRFPGTRLDVDTLMLIGTKDPEASIERCSTYTVADGQGSRPVEMKTFPGVAHNFDRENTEAARRSVDVTLAFLAAHLKAKP